MKKIEDYLKLPYTYEFKKEDDGTYFISVKELEGCCSVGDTVEEALEMIEDAKETWLSYSLEKGLPIPEPENIDSKSYSGKFIVRVTPMLHKQLSLQAKSSGVSLNYYVSEILAGKSSVIETQTRFIEAIADRYARQEIKALTSGTGKLGINKESVTTPWKSQTEVMVFPVKKRM